MSISPPVDHNVCVTVVAPARLHMGFLDLGGSLGRKFGSVGVGIHEIATRLTLVRSDRPAAEGPDAQRAVAVVEKLARAVGRPFPAAIRIHQAIPGHAGLGSGTQMDLAVGMGLSRLYELGLGVRDIAPIVERGARSGIGIAVFERGGVVVDGGRGAHTVIPPVIARLEMPSEWRFILILDERGQGLHGAHEVEAFQALPAFPAEQAAHLCHLLVMKGLPALAERDIAGFGAVIAELQKVVGDHFAPAQGGRFTSPDVGAALAFLAERGAVGIGQSSWGPTGFCLVDDARRAEALLQEARQRFGDRPALRFLLAAARNHGAEIAVGRADGFGRSGSGS
ncbi:beta-ribofuranosylaminobenzene 5'-phosphate synthase family protein [Methylocaldum sp. MU1018]